MRALFHLLLPWQPSFVVPLVLLAAAVAYGRGVRHVATAWPQVTCFIAGLIGFYIVAFTGFDYYAEHAFFMHRIQHAVLHHLAPFLIALSQPGRALMAGLPRPCQQGLLWLAERRSVRALVGFLNHPVVAVSLFAGLIVFWLIPPVHFVAMLDVRLYELMNGGMALNGLMFWGLTLNNFALRRARLGAGVRLMTLLAVIPPQIFIGLVLLMSHRDLYPIYSLCGRVFGLAPLADQQLGGVILWLAGAMMSVAGGVVVMIRAGGWPEAVRAGP